MDDDDPAVTVSYRSTTYSVAYSGAPDTTDVTENEVATVKVKLERGSRTDRHHSHSRRTHQDGASSADYSGVPANVVFNSGDTEKVVHLHRHRRHRGR